VGLASVLLLVPYIYRAQKLITQIIALFLHINRDEIKDKIQHYEDMQKEIGTSLAHIQKFFFNTTFLVTKANTGTTPEQKAAQAKEETKLETPAEATDNPEEDRMGASVGESSEQRLRIEGIIVARYSMLEDMLAVGLI
jgi:hypothetical protein